MKVSKVTIGRNSASVDYTDNYGNSIKHKGEFLPHPDFVEAVGVLREHLCRLTEQAYVKPIDADKEYTEPTIEELCENISVTGVQIKSGDAGERVIISGNRTLTSGRTLKLTSPSLNLDNDDYSQSDELSAAIDGVFSEAEEYVGGKHGGFEQKSIDFGAEEGADPFDNDEE